MTAESDKAPRKRFGKERWLRAALDVIAHEGDRGVRIDAIAARLGATKGSFYHHFKDRQDFIDQVVEFWVERFNLYVIQSISPMEGSASDRLYALMTLVRNERLDLYDSTFRAWAAQDPRIAERVRAVDLARFDFIRGLFEEIGFTGADLEYRTRVWLVFAAAYSTLNFPASPDIDQDLFIGSHAFFVGDLQGNGTQHG